MGDGAGVTSPVPVKLQFTFVIPHRTAKGDIHTVFPIKVTVEILSFCARWVKCAIAAQIVILYLIPVTSTENLPTDFPTSC